MIITIGRKPFAGALVESIQENACGGINISISRIPNSLDNSDKRGTSRTQHKKGIWSSEELSTTSQTGNAFNGRWPANVLLAHLQNCTHVGQTRVRSSVGGGVSQTSIGSGRAYGGGKARLKNGFADDEGLETIDVWDCAKKCTTLAIEEQGGASRFFMVMGVAK